MYLQSRKPVKKVYRHGEIETLLKNPVKSADATPWQKQCIAAFKPGTAVGYFVTYDKVTSLGGS